MNRNLERALTHFARVAEPPVVLQQRQAVGVAIDPATGTVYANALPSSTPLDPSWGPGDALRRYRTPRAGNVSMLAAFCTTPPSTGDAVITLTKTTETGGTETIATVRIPRGKQFSDPETLIWQARDVPAGAWLGASVTTVNSASGVNIGATVDIGAR